MEKKEKRAYDSYEDAFNELERILTTQTKPWCAYNKKPCRVYQAKDGKWYLTSKSTITTY